MMLIGKKINENGFPEFIIQETLPVEYEDITSVTNFIVIGKMLFKDYKWIRKRFQELDFDTLVADDKAVVCQYRGTSEDNCKLTLGNDFDFWSTRFGIESKKCREFRLETAKTILFKNISLADRYTILSLLNPTQLENNYEKHGIEGINDGDPIDGLFDFIEATNGYSSNGVATMNLTMLNGLTKEQMIVKMMDCLRDGEY